MLPEQVKSRSSWVTPMAPLTLLEDGHEHLDLVAVLDPAGVLGLSRAHHGDVAHQTSSL